MTGVLIAHAHEQSELYKGTSNAASLPAVFFSIFFDPRGGRPFDPMLKGPINVPVPYLT